MLNPSMLCQRGESGDAGPARLFAIIFDLDERDRRVLILGSMYSYWWLITFEYLNAASQTPCLSDEYISHTRDANYEVTIAR
jgi:hypothetical protein